MKYTAAPGGDGVGPPLPGVWAAAGSSAIHANNNTGRSDEILLIMTIPQVTAASARQTGS
jgi:hypothetical protein